MDVVRRLPSAVILLLLWLPACRSDVAPETASPPAPAASPTTSSTSTTSTTPIATTSVTAPSGSVQGPPERMWVGDAYGPLMEGTIFTTDVPVGDMGFGTLYELRQGEGILRAVCCSGPFSGTPFDDLAGGAVYTDEQGWVVRTTQERAPHQDPMLIPGDDLVLHDTGRVGGRAAAVVSRHEDDGSQGVVLLVDLETEEAAILLALPLADERLVRVSHASGRFLLTLEGESGGRFLLVGADGGSIAGPLPGPGPVSEGTLGPEATTMAFAERTPDGGTDLVVWDLSSGSELSRYRATLGSDPRVEHLEYDGERLLAERWTSIEEGHPVSPLGVDLSSGEIHELDGFELDGRRLLFRQVTVLREP